MVQHADWNRKGWIYTLMSKAPQKPKRTFNLQNLANAYESSREGGLRSASDRGSLKRIMKTPPPPLKAETDLKK
ncbi:MAG: hypothetical protein CBC83_10140 [Flavobacteriales bacterium TMED123]|nr:MAG: hypothetical protein CBC83_10140 [Flavobacteriales bacterium TMED123]